uniref:FH2 domain-containing protein n=1 Tax=Echinostoma caproni TaxID=27848 RepID=A0A183AP74_9TREM
LLNFYEELGDVATAAKVPMETLTSDVAALVAGMDQADRETIVAGPVGTPERLTEFVTTNKARVDSIQQQAEKAKTLFAQTIEWFGEAQNKPSPEVFFGLIARFVENFKKAVADNEKRRRADALRMLTAATEDTSSSSTLPSLPNAPITRKPKDRHLAHEARVAKRRFKNRTRQITGDGMMDEILAGLVSQPLQAEVHPRRIRASDDA